jgi:hypothetical protein
MTEVKEVEWFFGGAEKHNEVCIKLAKWIKRQNLQSKAACNLKNYRHKGRSLSLSPDIDVAILQEEKLIGCEVKLLAGRKAGLTESLLTGESRIIRGIDREIYSGLGQALYLLRYVDRAYLVLPSLRRLIENFGLDIGVEYVLKEAMEKFLLIGLIYFVPKSDQELEFEIIKEASDACLVGFHRTSLNQAIREHNIDC